ncbi:hypothetical protein [Sediminibacterium ginsengisoli]|uniref:Uncharacterized protein n=1 Tax=Sediminibacterium ginsengisoli TaxID=413434 RepID=A0A1T4R1B2_9BACT|nr:hypothetical protein [Sediminibacterium ginsengisoli]SKA09842.1 hypothetical protein SAMN04488132_11062 [Sediminibacterium ginsengisoli]
MRPSYQRSGRTGTGISATETGKGNSRPAVPVLQPHAAVREKPAVAGQQQLTRPTVQLQAEPVVQREDISQGEYDQVKQVALQIMEQYPPDKYHYLGLGKSPTPVIAFLQSYGTVTRNPMVSATNMPLSKFDHRSSSMSRAEKGVVNGAELNADQKERLSDHFDRFVMSNEEIVEGKSILLIDFVQSGRSLVATQRHLQEYLKKRYHGSGFTGLTFGILSALKCFPSPPKVEALPLAIQEQQVGGTKRTMDSLGLSGKAIMLPGEFEEENSLSARMGAEKYKSRAEYPDDFKISAPERPVTDNIRRDPRGEYQKMLSEFNTFMRQDGDLVRFIEGKDAVEELSDQVDETHVLLDIHED